MKNAIENIENKIEELSRYKGLHRAFWNFLSNYVFVFFFYIIKKDLVTVNMFSVYRVVFTFLN